MVVKCECCGEECREEEMVDVPVIGMICPECEAMADDLAQNM